MMAAPRAATVLLIDDERGLRFPLRLALERAGYVVLEASDGRQALTLTEIHGNSIAIVVIDHHMPGLSGAEVARVLRRRRAGLKIILMSGAGEEDVGYANAGADVFLRKPFHLIELVRTVRHLLDQTLPKPA